jgi:hypothetical protein
MPIGVLYGEVHVCVRFSVWVCVSVFAWYVCECVKVYVICICICAIFLCVSLCDNSGIVHIYVICICVCLCAWGCVYTCVPKWGLYQSLFWSCWRTPRSLAGADLSHTSPAPVSLVQEESQNECVQRRSCCPKTLLFGYLILFAAKLKETLIGLTPWVVFI